jgi:hypothetical protein
VAGVSGPSRGVGGRSRGGMGISAAVGGRVGTMAVGGGVGALMEPDSDEEEGGDGSMDEDW